MRKRGKSPPVGEWSYEGVGHQLHGGFGGKQHSDLDVLVEQLAAGLGAVGGVLQELCNHRGGRNRVHRTGCEVGA